MIKYKHIPTGDIFEKKILGVSPGEYYSYVCRCVQIHPYIVEQPKSKDWEKIEDDTEEYEITGVRYIEFGDIARKIDNSNDFEYIRTGKEMSIKTVHENLTSGKLEIFSVLRKRDNQEFKVGNTINWRYSLFDIKAFHKNCGKMFMLAKGANGIQSVNLDEILIWEKPVLFTSEDGKETREGDQVHVLRYTWQIVEHAVEAESIQEGIKDSSIWKVFSTKEAAENWVINNKPVWTLSEIWLKHVLSKESMTETTRERCGFIKKK
jgi:hypothetical protein